MRNRFYSIVGAVALMTTGSVISATAKVETVGIGANIFNAPYTIDFGTGSLTFSTINKTDIFNPDGVQTSGTVQVFSFGGFLGIPIQPTSFFANRGGEFGPNGGNLGVFASYPTATLIPFSGTESLVGFNYTAPDGVHYGYADIAGATLSGYSFNTTPGADVPFASIASPVPEPATWAMMLLGLAGLGVMGHRKARSKQVSPAMAS